MLLVLLVMGLYEAGARMIKPMRRDTALALFQRMDNSPDLISIDIGGTLAKVVLYQPSAEPVDGDRPPEPDLGDGTIGALGPDQMQLSVYAPELRGNLHFFVFETRYVSDVIDFMGKHCPRGRSRETPVSLRATGGGAYKHAADLRRIGFSLDLEDEMSAMVAGLNFLLTRVRGEVFRLNMDSYAHQSSPSATPAACAELARNYVPVLEPPEHYLYVSIGSGVSILEVHSGGSEGVTRYRRVGGSSIGGSSFWGLVSLLTACSSFDEVIRLTESGTSSNVDMLVGDIYGGDCDTIGLKANVIAASFGKVTMLREEGAIGPMLLIRWLRAIARHYEEGFWLIVLALLNLIPGGKQLAAWVGVLRFAETRAASVAMCGNFRAHDVALSLLRMISNNIGQIGTSAR